MKLFIDTEFTNLIPGNKLISIALVDENENYFYAELTDTYTLDQCSNFVKSNVLPLLRGGKYRMSFNECVLKISEWIENRGVECIIASDNPSWNLPHLIKLLEVLWPENLIRNIIYPVIISNSVKENIIFENNYHIHNALDDALTMKKAVCS